MKNDILEEIDKLRMMVVLDQAMPQKSDLEKYEDWIAEMQCRYPKCWRNHDPFDHCGICDPKKYAEYKCVMSLVEQLYGDKCGNTRKYQQDKREIRNMISEIVAMTMYIQEKK